MRTRVIAFPLLAGIVAFCLPMFAHHGSQAYEGTLRTMKDVTVTQFVWANPHCIVKFDAKDESGKVVHWTAELGSPSAITLDGFTKTSLKPGDIVTINIDVSKTGNPVGRIRRFQLADGSFLPQRGEGAEGQDTGGDGDRGGAGRGSTGGGAEY